MTRAASALLARSENFRQVLELRPCDALPSSVEIRITSWFLDAKDPDSPQVRFRTMSSPDALSGLKDALEAFLGRPEAVASRVGD